MLATSRWKVPPSGYMRFPSLVYAIQGKGILINTSLVPPDKEPKKWEDLLDPFWSGKKIVLGCSECGKSLPPLDANGLDDA